MNRKDANIIANYLNAKLTELTKGINHWGGESNKTDNSELRAKECSKNILHLQGAYSEIYSMYVQLKTDFN